MIIKRFNADFGNSTQNLMIDGYYFEIPTNVAILSKEEAEAYFVGSIEDPSQLLDRMMISTEWEGEVKYFLVGKEAENSNNREHHHERMHDKINSEIPYVGFLAAVAYYYTMHRNGQQSSEVTIEKMNMMLPIWLLTKEEKFSIAQRKMENRFIGEHTFSIITPGVQREIKVTVQNAKCRIESEVSRFVLKYRIIRTENGSKIELRKEAIRFNKRNVVLVDIGGGSTDAVGLGEGLTNPKNRDSFKVIDIKPFLGYLEDFRKKKLIGIIDNLRILERLIIDGYEKGKYKFVNKNTGFETDITGIVEEALNEYAKFLVKEVTRSFSSEDTVYIFIYIGGEAPILQPYIKHHLAKNISTKLVETNHLFLDDIIDPVGDEEFVPTPRTTNIAALEIISLDEMVKNLV